jgi:hypothetical protein
LSAPDPGRLGGRISTPTRQYLFRALPARRCLADACVVLPEVTTFGLVIGLIVGFPAGMAYAVARRAWKDFRATRTLVAGLRRNAWGVSRAAAGWLVGIVVLAVAAVGWAATGDPTGAPCPEPSAAAAAPLPAAAQPASPSPAPACAGH